MTELTSGLRARAFFGASTCGVDYCQLILVTSGPRFTRVVLTWEVCRAISNWSSGSPAGRST